MRFSVDETTAFFNDDECAIVTYMIMITYLSYTMLRLNPGCDTNVPFSCAEGRKFVADLQTESFNHRYYKVGTK